jgi:hypothetical protein
MASNSKRCDESSINYVARKKCIIMETIIKIMRCMYRCPFYTTEGQVMACNHPFWKTKEPYDNYIITQENGRDSIPEKCPLRKEDLIIKYRLTMK